MCIENGLRLGYTRAFKHSDNPDESIIIGKQFDAIRDEIYEWFDFPEVKDVF
jgi:hypothetical protein